MANKGIENLITGKERTKEELREITRKGGIASGEARRRKKTAKEVVSTLLNLGLTDEKAKRKLKALGIEDEDMTNIMASSVAVMAKAMKGDYKAYNALLEVAGEKVQEVKINAPVDDAVKEMEEYFEQKRNS